VTSIHFIIGYKIFPKARLHTFEVFIKDILHIQDLNVNGASGAVTRCCMSIVLCVLAAAK